MKQSEDARQHAFAGKMRAALEGRWIVGGTPPYGYNLDPQTKMLVINEEEAQAVRMMYQWLTDGGLSIWQIQKRLNGLDFPTKFARLGKAKRNSGCWWSYSNIYQILTRSAYAGWHEWHGVRIPCPPIVSPDVWAAGQERLARASGLKPKSHGWDALLRGLIHCGVCGRNYRTTRGHEGRFYYVCSSRNPQHSEKPCGAPNLRGIVLDALIWKMLAQHIQNPDLLVKQLPDSQKLEALQRELAFLDEALASAMWEGGWAHLAAIPAQESSHQDRLVKRRKEVLEELSGPLAK